MLNRLDGKGEVIMKSNKKIRIIWLRIGLLSLLVMFPASALAVPEVINYQGYLTDAGGNPLNGDVAITFSIYDLEVSGTALWSETHVAVTMTEGVFNAALGTSVPITAGILDGDRYLGITVGTDSEMVPRMKIVSGAYAIRAGYAENVADGAVTTSTLSDTAVTEVKIAGGAVSSAKLASDSVTSDKVVTGAVTETKIASAAVSNTKLASSSVTADKIAPGAVTGAKVASGTLTETHLQDGTALAEILDDDGAGSGLDADYLDGYDSGAFSLSGHSHDSTYVNEGQGRKSVG